MVKPPAILHPDSDKAHYVAQGVLGALAGISVLGMAWALWHGAGRGQVNVVEHAAPAVPAPTLVNASSGSPMTLLPSPAAPEPPPTAATAPALAPAAYAPMSGASLPASPGLATSPQTSPSRPIPPLSGVPLSPGVPPGLATRVAEPETPLPSLPQGKQMKNAQAIESVHAAREVRKLQDMQAALNELRAADLLEPNHPEVLGEMALTYELMGINSKAQTYWRQLAEMGEAAAGGYYSLAKSKLGAGEPLATPAPAFNPVSLGTCRVISDPTVKKGERITVSVPLIAAPGATIDPQKMDIHVLLYESVNNGERIEQVRSAPPQVNWVSEPVNWQDSREETADVIYDLPPPRPEEIRDLGKRKFHGYVVKLFYQDKLMGEQMQPETLRDTQRGGPTGLDNSLFPK